jgi:hypothetical protein
VPVVPVLDDVQVEQLDSRTAVVTFLGEHDLSTAEAVTDLLESLVERNELVVSDFSEAQFVTRAFCKRLFTLTARPSARDTRFACNSGRHRSFVALSRSLASMSCSTYLPHARKRSRLDRSKRAALHHHAFT